MSEHDKQQISDVGGSGSGPASGSVSSSDGIPLGSRVTDVAPGATPGQGMRAPKLIPSVYAQPHIISHHLPTPGETESWPFQNIGSWRVDVEVNAEAWREGMRAWRYEHLIRMGYDDSEYEREDLAWSQRNFVNTQMMVEDRYFYDPVAGAYTVDRYLDDLIERFGGIDSVLIWYIYPNIGIDDRNQFDLASDLPGGIEGLRGAVQDFQRRGVRVFLPTMPWDNGTNPSDAPDWERVASIAAAVGADGINGDTYYGVPKVFRTTCDATGKPMVLQPETWPIADEALMWNNQSWGRATKTVIPAVDKRKWLESRHMVNVESRWSRDRTDDFQYIFFNGLGYVAWENVWGIWNQFTPRDGETMRRISALQRQLPRFFVSSDWEPYTTTIQHDVYASRFGDGDCALWTVVNRSEYESTGDQLDLSGGEGYRFLDLWNGVELTPRIEGDRMILSFDMEERGFGAVLAVPTDTTIEGLDVYLAEASARSTTGLQSLSAQWNSLPQAVVAIERVDAVAQAPEGMVLIPAGEFDFRVNGIEIEGYTWDGVDFQYPWERSARRNHYRHMSIEPFYMDIFPVTNADFLAFVDAESYEPDDAHNFLRDWIEGKPQPGWENKPVTWVSLEDARAYCRWAGKRLPDEWEWQYAAQGTDGRLFPWGNEWKSDAAPEPSTERLMAAPADVGAHPEGASPFGVLDLVGNVWQWTSEFVDEHTRAAALRGGSAYHPQNSHWYFPQALQLDQHGKYLLMAPSKDRSGLLGFRCVVDAER